MRTSRQTEDMLYQNTCFYCLSEDMFCGQSEDMFSCQSNCMFHSRSEYMFRANQQTCFGAKTKSFDGDLRSNILCFQSEHVTYLLRRYARAYVWHMSGIDAAVRSKRKSCVPSAATTPKGLHIYPATVPLGQDDSC